MLSGTRRYLLVILLFLAAVGLTWGQRWAFAARLAAEEPPPVTDQTLESGASQTPEPAFIYFLDVDGWYRVTPYETVVRSHLDFSAESSEAMAAAIPSTLGEWQQVGADNYVGDDPAVEFYLKYPTVAIERIYEDASGQRLALTIIGNKGEDSFLLFSHTPETCYPGRLWQVAENRRESAPLDLATVAGDSQGDSMHAQYLLTRHAETGDRLMVLYWYLWDDPQRKSEDGVLSIRVSLFIPSGQSEEEALARAWDFVRVLFPSAMPWDRF